MSRFLILDIGAGTMDVLYHDTESDLHYKAVARSPVLCMAEKAASLPNNLLITGKEMGGGSISKVLKQRAKKAEVVMSVSSAATVHHNLEKVRSWGIKIVQDAEAEDLRHNKKYSALTIGDLEIERLKHILKGLGVSFSFDVVGICAQDHGTPPEGVSHLDYRHHIFKACLDHNPFPHALLYKHDEVPATLSRLTSIAESAKMLPTDEIYVMDSGMAAILGATMDPQARPKQKVLILDVATSHTIGAAIEGGQIAGFFEYHTDDITLERLESLLCELADGKLEHEQVLEEGGHGAYIRKAFGFQAAEIIVATGPKRRLIENSRLPIVLGSPLGDNMMTGAVGVLEAIRRRKALKPIRYL
ncbi:MAG: DUF1786 family protein [Desulfatiglandales bacterium]